MVGSRGTTKSLKKCVVIMVLPCCPGWAFLLGEGNTLNTMPCHNAKKRKPHTLLAAVSEPSFSSETLKTGRKLTLL